jgi:hypothetical protein
MEVLLVVLGWLVDRLGPNARHRTAVAVAVLCGAATLALLIGLIVVLALSS